MIILTLTGAELLELRRTRSAIYRDGAIGDLYVAPRPRVYAGREDRRIASADDAIRAAGVEADALVREHPYTIELEEKRS